MSATAARGSIVTTANEYIQYIIYYTRIYIQSKSISISQVVTMSTIAQKTVNLSNQVESIDMIVKR